MLQYVYIVTAVTALGAITVAKNNPNEPRTLADVMKGSDFRKGRLFPVLQVVQFRNEMCEASGNENGTCYTPQECEDRDGTASGNCASGYGVCCVFILRGSGESSENNTVLTQTAISAPLPDDNPITYKICPSNSNICRLRLDFNTFQIAGPATSDVKVTGGGALDTVGSAVGDCVSDTFTVTCPGRASPPVVCGTNTGQHMVLDASPSCHSISFNINGAAFMRQWRITVRQFDCAVAADLAGPSECLQFFTGLTGTFSSFNYVDAGPALPNTPFHLSSQNYNICIRREAGQCGICYSPIRDDDVVNMNNSFGLSKSGNNAAKSVVGAKCDADFLAIPGGEPDPLIADGVVNQDDITNANQRYCGRFFNAQDNLAATSSVCTQVVPFSIRFQSDLDEITGADNAKNNELVDGPAGVVGFQIGYAQVMCS